MTNRRHTDENSKWNANKWFSSAESVSWIDRPQYVMHLQYNHWSHYRCSVSSTSSPAKLFTSSKRTDERNIRSLEFAPDNGECDFHFCFYCHSQWISDGCLLTVGQCFICVLFIITFLVRLVQFRSIEISCIMPRRISHAFVLVNLKTPFLHAFEDTSISISCASIIYLLLLLILVFPNAILACNLASKCCDVCTQEFDRFNSCVGLSTGFTLSIYSRFFLSVYFECKAKEQKEMKKKPKWWTKKRELSKKIHVPHRN